MFFRHSRHRVILVGITWTIIAIIFIFLGYADGEIVCDDGYYYFEIARNVSLGEGFTFDSLHPTNGFHPLWSWILVPIFFIFNHSPWLPIHIAMSLCALFTFGTAILIYSFFARHHSSLGGELGAYVWLFNPYTVILSFRGLEGPLSTLLLAVSFYYFDRIRQKKIYSYKETAIMSITVGLCLLARTDNIFWLMASTLIALWDILSTKRWEKIGTKAFIFGAIILLIFSPWLVWNLITFGTIKQTSFQAKLMFDLHGQLPQILPDEVTNFYDLWHIIQNSASNLWRVAEYNAEYIMGEEWLPIQKGYTFLSIIGCYTVFLIFLPIICLRKGKNQTKTDKAASLNLLFPLGLYCIFHFFWYALISQNYYNWYFLPPVFVFSMFQGQRLNALYKIQHNWSMLIAGLLIMIFIILTFTISRIHISNYQQNKGDEIDFIRRYKNIIAAVPNGSVIGLWNAGMVGYFSSFYFPQKRIVNLDGLVNNEITQVEKDGKYEFYLLSSIDFLLEPPDFMSSIIGRNRTKQFIKHHIVPGNGVWIIK